MRLSPLFFKVSYETWTAAECPLKIEYAVEAMRDVQRMASARGGVKGVLYGRLDGQTLRILRVRIAPSGADDRAWAKLAASGPSGLTPAGLFAVRDEIALSKVELDILRRQFPAPWQVGLVMNRQGRAGFFAREHDGTLDPLESRSEFTVNDSSAVVPLGFTPAALERSRMADSSIRASFRVPSAAIWAFVGILSLAAGYGAAGFRAPQQLRLAIEDRDGRMTVSWDRAAVYGAQSAVAEIQDGPNRIALNLDAADLASGRLTYLRRSGDVSIRLRANALDEATRYVGRPPAAPIGEDIAALLNRSTQLVAESALNEARIRELQTTVDRLNARVLSRKR